MKIAVLGLWHLGGVASAGLCELGHTVFGIDGDERTVADFSNGHPAVAEPGLAELLKKHSATGRLSFSADFSALKNCDAVFLTFDTPVTENDEPDTTVLFGAVKKAAPHLKPDALFVVMSQVSVGVTRELASTIKAVNPSWQGEVVYFPENLQLGKAVECFLKPDRLVIGTDRESSKNKMESIVQPIDCTRLHTSIASAEMSKHALNAFLSTSLSFAYNISDLCEATGADITEVMAALKADKRIGEQAYLDTSIGFSGGTLMRDLRSLSQLGKTANRQTNMIDAVIKTNLNRRDRILERIEEMLGLPLSESTLAVLGVTYKPGTPTLRRSLSLELIEKLKAQGSIVKAHDPGADWREYRELVGEDLSPDAYEMAHGCHGIILVTAWSEFESLDFGRLKARMQPPYLFFDTRNVFREKEVAIQETGIQYQGLGR